MTFKRARIMEKKVPEFVAKAIQLQNFHFITFESGIYNIYFKPEVDLAVDFSKYEKVVVTESGYVTLFNFTE